MSDADLYRYLELMMDDEPPEMTEEEYIEMLKDEALYGYWESERQEAREELKSVYGIVLEDASDKQMPEDTL